MKVSRAYIPFFKYVCNVLQRGRRKQLHRWTRFRKKIELFLFVAWRKVNQVFQWKIKLLLNIITQTMNESYSLTRGLSDLREMQISWNDDVFVFLNNDTNKYTDDIYIIHDLNKIETSFSVIRIKNITMNIRPWDNRRDSISVVNVSSRLWTCGKIDWNRRRVRVR